MAKHEKTTQFDITNEIIQSTNSELTGTEKAVLIILSSYLREENQGVFKAAPSRATLSSKSSFGLSTVDRALKKLEELNYITSEQRMDNSKVYTWKGFDEDKSPQVIAFEQSLERKREHKKEYDRVRGANLGRNNAMVKKLEVMFEANPTERLKAEILCVKEARSKNIYFKDYTPYINLKAEVRKEYFTPVVTQNPVVTVDVQPPTPSTFSKKANETYNEDFQEERDISTKHGSTKHGSTNVVTLPVVAPVQAVTASSVVSTYKANRYACKVRGVDGELTLKHKEALKEIGEVGALCNAIKIGYESKEGWIETSPIIKAAAVRAFKESGLFAQLNDASILEEAVTQVEAYVAQLNEQPPF